MPKTKQFDEMEVLERARNVFWKKGYNGTSIDELVQATGLSRSSIYTFFTDKYGLYTKTLQQYQLTQQQLMLQQMPAGLSGKKKIYWFFKNSIATSISDKQRKGCFILNCTTELANIDNGIKRFVVANMEAMEAQILAWVKEGYTDGSIQKKFSAKALARNLYSSFNGLTLMGQTKPDKETLEDIVEVALSVLS
jgi:TetR/AcrR family transcriptional regulator, transcriptional repressor for nem operon